MSTTLLKKFFLLDYKIWRPQTVERCCSISIIAVMRSPTKKEITMYKAVITPRVSETDMIGHMNNTTLPVWFEVTRNIIFSMSTPDHDFKN